MLEQRFWDAKRRRICCPARERTSGSSEPEETPVRTGGARRCRSRPLRAGGGTRLKILEAAACGVPVVSTSVGVEGLALEAGKEVLVADDARSFASAICELLSDPVRRAKLAQAARARAEALYDWKQIGPGLAEQLLARSVA
jgi:glycosyltransferase involved in cell wall biosynthesis